MEYLCSYISQSLYLPFMSYLYSLCSSLYFISLHSYQIIHKVKAFHHCQKTKFPGPCLKPLLLTTLNNISFIPKLSEQVANPRYCLKVKTSHFCEVTVCNWSIGRVYEEGRRRQSWRQQISLKRRFLFTKLLGAVSHKAVIFIDTAVRNSNLKLYIRDITSASRKKISLTWRCFWFSPRSYCHYSTQEGLRDVRRIVLVLKYCSASLFYCRV